MGDERRAESIVDAFERAPFGPVALLDLSDDEIIALDARPRVATYPTIDVHDPLAVEAATRRGTAALALRDDSVDPREVVQLARSWRSVLLLEQQSALGHTHACAYLREDGNAVLEDVGGDGLHSFTAAKRAAAVDIITAAATPLGDAEARPGEALVVGAEGWESYATEELAEARVVTVVHGLRNFLGTDQPDRLDSARAVVYALPDCILLAEPAEASLRVTRVSRRTLRPRLLNLTLPAEERETIP